MITVAQKKNRQNLIDALRSGKYAKTTRRLRRGSSFCYQGVACDITDGYWKNDIFYTYSPLFGCHVMRIHSMGNIISSSVFGLDVYDRLSLTWMNDGDIADGYTLGEECTFEEIADCMELLTLAGI